MAELFIERNRTGRSKPADLVEGEQFALELLTRLALARLFDEMKPTQHALHLLHRLDNDLQMAKQDFNKSSAVAETGGRGNNRHGPKRGGLLCPFRGSWDPVWYNVAWAEVYFGTKRRLDAFSRLATIKMGQKLWALSSLPPFLGEESCVPM